METNNTILLNAMTSMQFTKLRGRNLWYHSRSNV